MIYLYFVNFSLVRIMLSSKSDHAKQEKAAKRITYEAGFRKMRRVEKKGRYLTSFIL